MSALDSLVEPSFAKNPSINLDAKIVGIVLAILAGLGLLLGLLALLALFAVGGAYGRILALAFIGLLINLAADVLAVMGGWQMFKGNPEGKRLAVYGLALAFVAMLVSIVGYGFGFGYLIQIIILLAVYYAVVASRFSPADRVPTP